MTRDEIIKLAREAGLTERNHHSEILVRHSNGSWVDVEHVLWRFAALVAAAEREACAKVCDFEVRRLTAIDEKRPALAAGICAATIRARSQQ